MRVRSLVPLALIGALAAGLARADFDYHKNTLLGGRAATMGGAYTAISDDASGAFYNPAGLAYAASNSISGSANTYSTSKAVYKGAIDGRDWERSTGNLTPNYFGVVQKRGEHTFAFSYAVTDTAVEDQDQLFQNLTGTVDPIDLYVLNLHSQDHTYLAGPSYSRKLNEQLSFGASLFFQYRIFRRTQSQLIRYTDGDDEASYLNNTKKEKGLKPKFGLMYSPAPKWSVGATLSKSTILTALNDTQLNQKTKGAATYQFSQLKRTNIRTTPYELETGVAWFKSAFLLLSANLDFYYFDGDPNKKNVWNLSFGSEYFLSEKHALRGGLYTNRSNSPVPSKSTTAPTEHVDLYGVTAGYTYYAGATALTFGTLASQGAGKAQIYSNSTARKDVVKTNLDFVVSADYGF